MNPSFRLIEGNWQEHRQSLTDVCWQVFVDEQGIPVSLELDETETGCHDVLVVDSGGGGLQASAESHRMVILAEWL